MLIALETKVSNWGGVAQILEITTQVENPCYMLKSGSWFRGKIQDFVCHFSNGLIRMRHGSPAQSLRGRTSEKGRVRDELQRANIGRFI